MAADIPSVEPETITAGDSATWEYTLPDYSTADGWAVSYVFRQAGAATLTISASGSGTTYTTTISTSNSTLLKNGLWYWTAFATKTGQRVTIRKGRLEVQPDPAGTGQFDPRSQVKRTLDAINATLEGTADREERQLVVDGLSLEVRDVAQLLALKDRFDALYQAEVAAERLAKGLGNRRKIVTRFVNPQ